MPCGGQKGYSFLPSFIKEINRYYNGGFFTVDFARNTEQARMRINSWIEKKTNGKIRNLIAKGDINRSTRLVLTNAIYFKGKWVYQFKKENTKNFPFYVSNNKLVKTPMMYDKGRFPYYEGKKIKIIELPYSGGDFFMLIVLPKEIDGLSEIENSLTLQKIDQLIGFLRKREVRVYLPRFKLETKYHLKNVLSEMGMPKAFSGQADFSGIDGKKSLKISKIIHQAYVDVNEEGTEASAATSVSIGLTAVYFTPVFKANHPFLFMIIHKETRSILFMGRLVKP